MAACEVCKLNQDGKVYWTGCLFLDDEVPVNCRQCRHVCGGEAILIAGKNICIKHKHLIIKRILNKDETNE